MEETHRIYLDDQYARSCKAKILNIIRRKGRRAYIILDRTVFHPLGSGQPSDTGMIRRGESVFVVKKVLDKNGKVLHYGVFRGSNFSEGDEVLCVLDWKARYAVMRLHTGGHILDYAVMRSYGGKVATISAFHGPPTAFIEYAVEEKPNITEIESIANSIVARNLPVVTRWVDRGELWASVYNAPNMDRVPLVDKYRIVEVKSVNAMPCMGTHVAYTLEVGRLIIEKSERTEKGWKIYYRVEDPNGEA